MTKYFRLLCLILILPSAVFAAPPKSVKATYEMYRNRLLIANVEETFIADNGNYQIQSAANPSGVLTLFSNDKITRQSRGTIDADGLRPDFFEEKQTGRKERLRTANFDWNNKKITLNFDNKSETAELPKGTQDWSSLYYQFFFKAPAKSTMQAIVTNGKKVETYSYKYIDEVAIDIPAGKFDTQHYLHKEEKGDRSTELWLAKDKSFFPVRVILHEDGNDIEQRLVDLKIE